MKASNKTYKTLAVAGLILSASTVMANSDPIDVSPLIGEYVATNPGLEAIIPNWLHVDHDGDGAKDGYDFHFDVYKLGTKTKLFATAVKYLPYTVSACAAPNVSEYWGKDFEFKRIGANVILSTSIDTYCGNLMTGAGGNKYTTYIYAVNVSSVGKTPWVKSFSGNLVGTGILPDTNSNGTGELSVEIKTGAFTNNNGSFFVYDGLTGVALATPQAYAIER